MRKTIASSMLMLLLLAGCGAKSLTSTPASTATPAPVVNCDADVDDQALTHLPAPPASAVPNPTDAQLRAAYNDLYTYDARDLLPWAQSAEHVWSYNHELRQRTSACLGILRTTHVIN